MAGTTRGTSRGALWKRRALRATGKPGFATGKRIPKTSAIVSRLTDQWWDGDRAALGIDRDIGKVSARSMFSFSG
jgi:hypothetical protein